MKKIITAGVLFIVCTYAQAQSPLPKYPMVFEFTNAAMDQKDTSLSFMQLKHWAKSDNFPSLLKWKNSPFGLKSCAGDTVKLYTDSITSYSNDDVIGYLFFKTAATGTFRSDYKSSTIGRYLGNSGSPNIDLEITTEGIRMKAHGAISANTLLTINYNDLYDMFPDDPTVIFVNY